MLKLLLKYAPERRAGEPPVWTDRKPLYDTLYKIMCRSCFPPPDQSIILMTAKNVHGQSSSSSSVLCVSLSRTGRDASHDSKSQLHVFFSQRVGAWKNKEHRQIKYFSTKATKPRPWWCPPLYLRSCHRQQATDKNQTIRSDPQCGRSAAEHAYLRWLWWPP